MYSKGVRIFLAVLAVYSLFSVYMVYQKKAQSDLDVRHANERLLELSLKEGSLMKEIDHLQTDEGLEAEIRGKYSVAKNNEYVVILVEDEEATTTEVVKNTTLWLRIKKLFGL